MAKRTLAADLHPVTRSDANDAQVAYHRRTPH